MRFGTPSIFVWSCCLAAMTGSARATLDPLIDCEQLDLTRPETVTSGSRSWSMPASQGWRVHFPVAVLARTDAHHV